MQQPTELLGEDSPHKLNKRKDEIQAILDDFINRWNDLETAVRLVPIENAAQKITDKYFELLQTTIRVYLPKSSNSNKYKVASGSEIATMFVLPIQISDPEYNTMQKREVNARFGIQLAITLLYSIHFEDGNTIPIQMATNENLSRIIDNHRLWLSRLNVKNLQASPTFINSNFWEAYFFASTEVL